MIEERMLSSAYEVLAVAPVNPGEALAEIASAEEAIRAGQRSNDQPVIRMKASLRRRGQRP